jgi:Tfp pilus assembly protein PilF
LSLISDALKKVEEQRATGKGRKPLLGLKAVGRLGQRRRWLTIGAAALLIGTIVAAVSIYVISHEPRQSSRTYMVSPVKPAMTRKKPAPAESVSSPTTPAKPPAVTADSGRVKKDLREVVEAKKESQPPAPKVQEKKISKPVRKVPLAVAKPLPEPKPRPTTSPKPLPPKAAKKTRLVKLSAETRQSPVEIYQEAVAFQKQGRWQEAEESYRRLLERLPMSAEIYNNLGVIYEKQGELKKAARYYEKAIEIDPHYYAGYNNLGVVSYKQEDYERARSAYERALALKPDNYQSLVNLALVYKRSGRQLQAQRALVQVLNQKPNNPEARYNLAQMLDEQGDHEGALEHYRYFLALRPSPYPRLQQTVQNRVHYLQKAEQR